MKLKQILLAGIAAGAANIAMATTGTITFNGQVVASTCAVTVDNSASATATVTLPTVNNVDLNGTGKTAGDTHFTINVTDCTAISTPLITSIKTRFLARNVTGAYLANTAAASAATNVAIELLEDTGVVGSVNVPGASDSTATNTRLDFTTGYAESGTKLLADAIDSNVVKFPFVARYVATDVAGAGAGAVQAIVDYELAYQ
ncbi:fimbrial protein [Acinetobacter sp.]|uniref:fimbrial protein n=1 Tax=Acinetobacter sp. TaxID=472 RepID=UPI003CFC7E45